MNFLNRLKYARDSYLITILIVMIALMVNFIASRNFVRVDLTKNQIYAVSEGSKKIMKDLDDIVTVKVFFSETLPPNLFIVKQYVNDMLGELSSYSRGNLFVNFLDPSDQKVRNEALSLGIPQIQMNIVEKDKLEVKNGFLGIAIIYGDRQEILPVVQNIMNVEYDLVAAIKKVTAEEDRTVGFVIGHEEPSLADRITVETKGETYSFLKRALERNYNVAEVDLEEEGALDGIDTLIVAGSKTSFSDDEKYFIDQFILSGGNLVVMLDTIDVDSQLQASLLDTGLDEMLENYGAGFVKEFVLDRSNENASFNQGFVNFIVPYPYWIKAINNNFDKSNPIAGSLDSVVFPWTSPIRIIETENVKATALISTTKEAWTAGEPFNLDPGAALNYSSRDQYPLAVMLEGEFSSYFSEKSGKKDFLKSSENPGRILIVGNSRFITDRFLNNFGQNLAFAMNAIDFLTLDESLIGIRSKMSFDLPLKDMNARDRQIVKLTGTLLMPVLVVIFGILYSIYRRRKKINL